MKFIYFTDIHLDTGEDWRVGFERCLASMMGHEPQVLINGGDLGITPEAIAAYEEMTKDLPVEILLSNGNHEMCSGYLPRERAGTDHRSVDLDGAHVVVLDMVQYFEPTEAHPANWYGLADEALLEWLAEDLSRVDRETPLVVVSYIPLSSTFTFRMGGEKDPEFPTNDVRNADRVLDLLRPFEHVATLHGHDHENCRHFVDRIEVMTAAAVSGNWWRNGLYSLRTHSREPQGYRLMEMGGDSRIRSRYLAFDPAQDRIAELFCHPELGRQFVNVIDGSPRTRVTVEGVGDLAAIDPNAASSVDLSTHFYALPEGYDRQEVEVGFEDGRVYDLVLKLEAEL